MTTKSFSEETKEYLIGKTIVSVSDNYIVLSDGCRIYIEDAEIDFLNDNK